MKLLLSLLMMLGLYSCSAKKTVTDLDVDETEMGLELDDSDELSEDLVDESTDELISEDTDIELSDNASDMGASDISVNAVGDLSQYTVQKGDTLMMIAFKIYGDYSKWKDLADLNKDKLHNGQLASVGSSLKYYAPTDSFSWSPEGNPYLIKNGDTLGSISYTTYGRTGYWRNIWDNNKPLIKNPNKIYAGFTIYTPLIEGRDVATE